MKQDLPLARGAIFQQVMGPCVVYCPSAISINSRGSGTRNNVMKWGIRNVTETGNRESQLKRTRGVSGS